MNEPSECLNGTRRQLTVGQVMDLLRLYHPDEPLLLLLQPNDHNIVVVGANDRKTAELCVPCLDVDYISKDSAGIETEQDVLNRRRKLLDEQVRAIERELRAAERPERPESKKTRTSRKKTRTTKSSGAKRGRPRKGNPNE